ncbi:MAG: hypothetical protein JNK38_26540 [Acidobacteria bacterium]|nr:hypothetical protein [Acidobacteriota bacterium]
MKKTIIIMTFFMVCACGLGWAQDSATSDIRQSIRSLRSKLNELEMLKVNHNKLSDTEKTNNQATYIRNAKAALEQIKSEKSHLAKQVTSFLENLSTEKREEVEQKLNDEVNRLDEAIKQISSKFNGTPVKITSGIEDQVPNLKIALNEIENSISPLGRNSGVSTTPSPPGTSPNLSQPSNGWALFDYIPYALLFIAFLGVAAAFFWIDRRMAKLERSVVLQSQNSAGIQEKVSQLDEKLVRFSQQVGHEFNAALDEVWENIDKQQSSNSKLKAEIERLRTPSQQTSSRNVASGSPVIRSRREESDTQGAAYEPAVAATRIVSVREYLTRFGSSAIKAQAVMFRPEVLQQSDDDGPYVLIQNDSSHDTYKVIPSVPRFQSSQDYSHFSHFYDCDQASSGEVLIVEPALARYDGSIGQWTLLRKGRLQVS